MRGDKVTDYSTQGNILMIEITLEEYNRLTKAAFKLTCLENAGVDNWNGYDYAMDKFYGRNEDDEE